MLVPSVVSTSLIQQSRRAILAWISIFQVHLSVTGCHHGWHERPARVFNANEFKHVEFVGNSESGKDKGDPRVESLYCQLQFGGQATRIQAHLAGTSLCICGSARVSTSCVELVAAHLDRSSRRRGPQISNYTLFVSWCRPRALESCEWWTRSSLLVVLAAPMVSSGTKTPNFTPWPPFFGDQRPRQPRKKLSRLPHSLMRPVPHTAA
jgi:hypothetical protein